MKNARRPSLLKRVAALAAALFAAPALASAMPATAPDLAAWLAQTTDIPASEVVIAGPENVYSLEPLGPRLPTGEVIALVRTEAVAPEWSATHRFKSWDAHILFDCPGGRLRVMRSASYSENNRKGQASPETSDAAWLSPAPSEPSARLLVAACDAAFAGPLSRRTVAAASHPAPQPAPAAPMLAAAAPVAGAVVEAKAPAEGRSQGEPAPATGSFAVQLAYGPQERGAQRALNKARVTLGSDVEGFPSVVASSRAGRKLRFTAMIGGFPSLAAAAAACERVIHAGRPCFTRRATASVVAALAQPPPPAVDAKALRLQYAIQVARGPFQDGARRALANARAVLGSKAERLSSATELSRIGPKRRYAAVLSGFASPAEAEDACRALAAAGKGCLTRTTSAPSPSSSRRRAT